MESLSQNGSALPITSSPPLPKDSALLSTTNHEFPKRSSSILDPAVTATPITDRLGDAKADQAELQRLSTPTIVVHNDEDLIDSQPKSIETRPPRSTSLQHAAPILHARPATTGGTHSRKPEFLSLSTPIPTGSLLDLSADRVQFSNRGSLILLESSGQKSWSPRSPPADASTRGSPRRRKMNGQATQMRNVGNAAHLGSLLNDALASPPPEGRADSVLRSSKVMSTDEANLSRRVRAMYENGTDDPFVESTLVEEDEDAADGLLTPTRPTAVDDRARSRQTLVRSTSRAQRSLPHETAGGIEDWEDVKGEEVDRYGFIITASAEPQSSRASAIPTEAPTGQRISTPLLEVSNSPRKKGVLRRMPSRTSTIGTAGNGEQTPKRHASRRSVKPQGSIYSYRSNKSIAGSQSSLRSPLAIKDRKLMIDAADMLTMPAGLSEFGANGPRDSPAAQHKEREREVKWKKMARLQPGAKNGSGMRFDFDTSDPKLISRTWKGIPDRWRATAWYSFLEASARKHKNSASEAELLDEFHKLLWQDSADDVQIDMDVPRTINKHIMFRRRYRGGQRLLFRVLHALSLYFPAVGYVQGMAALAATLLCYYDEERTFVMMVRLWQLRGLHRLYESGFEGLMQALNEFEKDWLLEGDVAKKLEELGIHCTAYGTRWYLTLFNYSIPFPAQLRVWDVFMLLDQTKVNQTGNANLQDGCHAADLDVLHATSAALMDATREIILDSDFENAMKILTSWIPIKDEDLLMKVAHAEWKQRKRRAGRLRSN